MDKETINILGWIALRLTMGYVYLYALYMNTKDSASRAWLLEHTAYMFPNASEPTRSALAKWAAILGMLIMLVGGLSVLLGVEARVGASLLLAFTAGGIYQHSKERSVAMDVAARIASSIPEVSKKDFSTLQWSAYSGHFSSGLKNYALCGICAGLVAWGDGPDGIIICDYMGTWFH